MGNWDYPEHSYSIPRGDFLDLLTNELSRKHLPLMLSLIKNGGDQRRSGTVVVFAISQADSRLV